MTTMKTTILLLAIVGLAVAAPKPTKLHFRNLFKQPVNEIKVDPHPRIIGGREATPHSIPFQVFLEVYSGSQGWYCGASLISQYYVLTAGHCGDGATEAHVTLGAHNIMQSESSQVTVVSRDINVHENYDGDEIINDIAVIRLPRAVSLSSAIQPVSLPSRSQSGNTYAGDTARISGWGLTDGRGSDISDVLNYVDVEVMTNRDCERIFGSLLSSILCTSGQGGVGSCSGDSGGPLVTGNVQIGIVSYGVQYCPDGYPSAFTRVTSFLDWIASNSDVLI